MNNWCDTTHNPRELIAAIDSLPGPSKHPFIYRDGNNKQYLTITRDQVVQQMETRVGQVVLSKSKKKLLYLADFGNFTEEGRMINDCWVRFIFEPYEVPFSVGTSDPASYTGVKVTVEQCLPQIQWPAETFEMNREEREKAMREHYWLERRQYLLRPKAKHWGEIAWTIFWDGENPYAQYMKEGKSDE